MAIPLVALMILGGTSKQASAQAEPFLGQIMVFAGNFCPRGWTHADGKLLAISQYSAVFSLLGTSYGGDGRTTFGVPDLRGRSIIGNGRGPGLQDYRLGSFSGAESHVLLVPEMPSHQHFVNVTNLEADKGGPGNDFLAGGGREHFQYHEGPANRTMDPGVISFTGSNVPFNIRGPYLVMTTCLALEGIFPSRS